MTSTWEVKELRETGEKKQITKMAKTIISPTNVSELRGRRGGGDPRYLKKLRVKMEIVVK